MNSQDIRPDDRETLSALFDGELDADARLFAMRRLGHDEAWQRACGQWQLIGDAMRRSAPIMASSDFASRVATAVAAEAAPSRNVSSGASHVAARTRGNARWIGGALAASVALAAIVSMLPSRQDATGDATTIASAPAPAPTTTIAASPSAPPADVTAVPPAAPSVRVVAETAPRIASVQPRPRRASATVAPDETAPRAGMGDVALLVDETGNPFNLATDEALTTRPWPRATLAGSAFTARFGAVGDSSGERPSFYPFEPRPQGEAEPAQTP